MNNTPTNGRMDVDAIRREIQGQIAYDSLHAAFAHRLLDELVQIIVEVMVTITPTIRVGHHDYPTGHVQKCFGQLRRDDMEYILKSVDTDPFVCSRDSLLAALFDLCPKE